MEGKTLTEIHDIAGWAIDCPDVAKSVMQLCGYIAKLEKEIADIRSDIHDLQTRLSEMETE